MLKKDLITHLDAYLNINGYEDSSKNGLQVDVNKTNIQKIGFAVDTTTYLIDRAIREGVDLLIVHHGMFWGHEKVITDLHFERVSRLIKNNIGLYAAHLPVDAHPEVGNNIELIRVFIKHFNIEKYTLEKFGEYHGETIGFGIRFADQISFDQMEDFCRQNNIIPEVYNFGNKSTISSFCAISGGGGDEIDQAKNADYDVFLTGEGAHYSRIVGKELGQSVIYGGHYETEVFGVKAIARHLSDKFNLETVFLDEKY